MALLLDAGNRYSAAFIKILTGGRNPIPVVEASLHGENATLKGLHHANANESAVTEAYVEVPKAGPATNNGYKAWPVGVLIIGILLLLGGQVTLGLLALAAAGLLGWVKSFTTP
jgi:hypothetical protein